MEDEWLKSLSHLARPSNGNRRTNSISIRFYHDLQKDYVHVFDFQEFHKIVVFPTIQCIL